MEICKVEKVREIVNTEYSVRNNKYCCKKMKRAMVGKDIECYDDGSGKFNHVFRISEGSITVPLAVDNGDYSGVYYHTKINYCPWCGKRIGAESPTIKSDSRLESYVIEKKKHWWN